MIGYIYIYISHFFDRRLGLCWSLHALYYSWVGLSIPCVLEWARLLLRAYAPHRPGSSVSRATSHEVSPPILLLTV